VVIYDALTGDVVAKRNCHRSIVRDVSWHPDRPHLVTSSVRYVRSELLIPGRRRLGVVLRFASFFTQLGSSSPHSALAI
jgi:hypothetical protein